jgi:hypothetical protein
MQYYSNTQDKHVPGKCRPSNRSSAYHRGRCAMDPELIFLRAIFDLKSQGEY